MPLQKITISIFLGEIALISFHILSGAPDVMKGVCVYFCFAGVCDDCCVWSGVHHSHLGGWMLLSLQGMARTTALCKKTILCHR